MKCWSQSSSDGVEAEVERVKHELRKVTPIPPIYNDALVDIATQVEDEAVAASNLSKPKVFYVSFSKEQTTHSSHESRRCSK